MSRVDGASDGRATQPVGVNASQLFEDAAVKKDIVWASRQCESETRENKIVCVVEKLKARLGEIMIERSESGESSLSQSQALEESDFKLGDGTGDVNAVLKDGVQVRRKTPVKVYDRPTSTSSEFFGASVQDYLGTLEELRSLNKLKLGKSGEHIKFLAIYEQTAWYLPAPFYHTAIRRCYWDGQPQEIKPACIDLAWGPSTTGGEVETVLANTRYNAFSLKALVFLWHDKGERSVGDVLCRVSDSDVVSSSGSPQDFRGLCGGEVVRSWAYSDYKGLELTAGPESKTYRLLTNNCNHYTEEVIEKLVEVREAVTVDQNVKTFIENTYNVLYERSKSSCVVSLLKLFWF